MSTTPKSTVEFFLEQTDLSLRLARCSGPSGQRSVEAIREVLIGDAAGLEEAVHAVFQGTAHPVSAALRPKSQVLHLATPAEARTHPGMMGVRQLAHELALSAHAPGWVAATQSRDGGAPGDTSWLAAYAAAEDRAEAAAMFQALHLTPGRLLSATHLSAGALAESVKEPALLLEIGLHSSQALMIGRAGVMAAGSVSLGVEQIAEAVQTELNLKYRGSAQKLFLNEQYDFSEAAAAIVNRLVPALRSELSALYPSGPAAVALLCSGLPAKQQWFATQLAQALNLAPFAPDFTTWCRAAGLSFVSPHSAAELSPLWMGFLQMLITDGASPEWNAEWSDVVEPKSAPRPAAGANPVPAPVPAPAKAAASAIAAVTPAPAPVPVKTAAVVPVAPQPVASARTATIAAPVATVAAPAAPTPVVAKPVPVVKAVPAAANPAPVTVPVAAKPPAPPVVPVQPVVAAAAAVPKEPAYTTPFHRKTGVLISAILAVVVAFGGYFYVQNRHEEAARIATEKARAEQQLRQESERARLAEEKAREEAESRKKFEFTLNQKLAATEAARAEAETEARTQAAARLANARGRVVITTEPAGALVTVGTLDPRPSPATFDDVRIGEYPVTIALAGYDSVQLPVEIKEGATSEPDMVTLVRITGTLEITSNPADADFEIKPANALLLTSADRHTGKTPATLSTLSPGDYVVTFNRAGWTPHTETISVGRDATARTSFAFPMGTVRINSAPIGATVMLNGTALGTTPLTLEGVAPGDLHYDIVMDGYRSGNVRGRLDGGGILELRTPLLTVDGITHRSEIDANPVPLVRPDPVLPERYKDTTAFVSIEITVDKDGTTRDPVIVSSSNPDVAKVCVAAVLKWKFKPATSRGQPVSARVTLPFSIKPK